MDGSSRMLHAGPNFLRSFRDAPHGNADFDEEATKFCGRSARDCNSHQNFQDAPHGRAILNEKTMKFSGCSARERDCLQNFLDAPHGGAISFQIFRIFRTGARFLSKLSGCSAENTFPSKFSGCSAREHLFCSNENSPQGSTILFRTWTKKTTLSGAFWYRIGMGSIP